MILIVDFGSQFTHLIGRRLKDIGCQYVIIRPEDTLGKIQSKHPSGIILSGGPSSVYEKNAPTIHPDIFTLNIPILGICYGWQLMAKLLGGDVKNTTKEYGPQTLTVSSDSPLFNIPKKTFQVYMSHGDTVITPPSGFTSIAQTKTVAFAGASLAKKQLFGIQFHPEADHTMFGNELLTNFVHGICKEPLSPSSLNPVDFIDSIRETVKNKKVLCAVSGGVDSTVTAALIGQAIGSHLIPIYIESGLMRPNTKEHVKEIFKNIIKTKLVIIDARKQFLSALKGVTDPEVKRKTVGKLYIKLFEKEAKKHRDATFLAQGTIYSDVIESKGTKNASHIKSHHNVGGLPGHMKLKLLEPVRALYKDEVRTLGKHIGLPENLIKTQPFPGPGYAVRVRGEVTKKRLEQVIIADSIVMEEMNNAGLLQNVFQCFAVMTGAYSTAVKGDERAFAEVVAIRAYESRDIMTSDWARIPYDVLARMASRIVNEVPDVSRVVYDITTKPPATMEWE